MRIEKNSISLNGFVALRQVLKVNKTLHEVPLSMDELEEENYLPIFYDIYFYLKSNQRGATDESNDVTVPVDVQPLALLPGLISVDHELN